MAKSYPINPNFGIILTDDGGIIPMTNEGPVESGDAETLLKMLLAAAVEVDYLEGELHRVAGAMGDILAEFGKGLPKAQTQSDSLQN